LIRKLAAGFWVVMALVACGQTEDPGEIIPQPEEETPPAAGPEVHDLLLVTGSDGKVTVIQPDGTLVRELRGPVGP